MKRVVIMAIILLIITIFSTPAIASSESSLLERIVQLEKRVAWLEQKPPVAAAVLQKGMFSGEGYSLTKPFNVDSVPWKIRWQTETSMQMATFDIVLCDATKPEGNNAIKGYYFNALSGVRTGQTYSYLPVGRYYLTVDTLPHVRWEIWIER